jgi:tetratricopeptide (TPR) repeat protein
VDLARAQRARLVEALAERKEQGSGGTVDHHRDLERCRLRGDRRGEAIELNRLAAAYRREGQVNAAHVCLLRALTISAEITDPQCQGLTLNSLGLTYAKQGLPEQAIPCYAQAAEIFHSRGEAHIEGEVLANLGRLYRIQGREEDGVRLLREAERKLDRESPAHRRATAWIDAASSSL